MNNNQALSQDIDMPKIMKLQDRINNNSAAIDGIVNRLVNDYCKQLDEYIINIQKVLQDVNNPPTNEELDFWVMELATLLYFVGEGQETLGIKEDVSKAIKMEAFNEAYEKANVGKSTIADKTAAAETASMNEYIVNTAYSRAYKKIKRKAELGAECLQSIKKVISRRLSEAELSKINIGGIK